MSTSINELSEEKHDIRHHRDQVLISADQSEVESGKTGIEAVTDDEVEIANEANTANVTPHSFSDIPDGGTLAWLQVLGSFFLFFNSWGVVNTYGVFQTYYESGLLSAESPSNISWIGSVQAFLLMLVGVITGPLYDAGWLRELLFSGTFLLVFGMMMTSLSKTYWQVFLAQGICQGIACGCLFVPSVATVSTYFSKKKALATGIAASGSSLGGVLYPIIFHNLQPRIGFPWATRVVGFIALGTLMVPLIFMKQRVRPPQKRNLIDMSAFRETTFWLCTAGLFFGFMGLYIPFFYVQTYSIDQNIMNADSAFYMLSIINAASIFGRIIPNYLADRLGPLNVLIPATLVACVVAFAWIGIHSVGGIIVLCLIYGFTSGSFVSIPPTVIVSLSPSLSVVGTRMGMTFALSGLGLLIGTPVAGQIVLHNGYVPAIALCGATVLMAVLFLLAVRLKKTGLHLMRVA